MEADVDGNNKHQKNLELMKDSLERQVKTLDERNKRLDKKMKE